MTLTCSWASFTRQPSVSEVSAQFSRQINFLWYNESLAINLLSFLWSVNKYEIVYDSWLAMERKAFLKNRQVPDKLKVN